MKRFPEIVFIGVLLCAAVFLCGCTGTDQGQVTPAPTEQITEQPTTEAAEKVTLAVYHAGSLAKPFELMETEFEDKYTNVDVQLHAGGSTKLAKEIIDLDKKADVYASADYSLIPNMLMPANDSEWYATFAKNKMVLTYTNKSKYADEISADNWYTILAKDDIKWAFSDPNLDPCGYRTPMVIQLAEGYYGDDQIFENTVSKNSNINVTEVNGTYTIHTPEELEPKGTLQIRPKSVELVQMVQAGGLDYAWEYRSVAVQNGLSFIELPDEIDLSSILFKDNYATVEIACGGGLKTGKPIVYGVTIPANSQNPDVAADFVAMLVGDVGQSIMEEQGQPPIVPAQGFGANIPETVAPLLEVNES